MWTANLDSITKTGGDASIKVTYTNGNSNVTETYTFATPTMLKATVANKINELNAVDNFISTTSTGPIDTTLPAPTPDPVPTQAELDRQQFLKDYQNWVKVKTTLIDTGILTGSEAAVVALKTKVQNTFKPAYLPYI